MPAGRPSKYSEETTNTICGRIADGESLRAILREEGMPSASTVFAWMEAHPEFRNKYARAREIQAEMLADELQEIADDGQNDWMERKNANGESIGWAENGEALRRSQLRVATRQWIASKLLPKKYGEKVAIGGAEDLPAIKSESAVTLTPSEAYKRMIEGK